MRICAAQTRPIRGDIEKNIENHRKLIEIAVVHKAEVIIFPELSLIGYEPKLAKDLATDRDDERFDEFQKISDLEQINIGVGVPTKTAAGILISMLLFQGNGQRGIYSKQTLHSDELPYFVQGREQILINKNEERVALAICYESLLPEHSEKAHRVGVDIYFASVAKSAKGVEKAFKHFPKIAKEYSMTVLMANCVGQCDDFESVGQSSIWNKDGLLVGQLNDSDEGILLIDSKTGEVIEKSLDIFGNKKFPANKREKARKK